MERFKTKLVSGGKAPYSSWTFLVLPEKILKQWGQTGRIEVRGTLAGVPFRGAMSRGEGVHRMPVRRALLEQAGVSRGDVVDVTVELDRESDRVEVPEELRAILDDDAELAALFDEMPPSHRRAWAGYVAEAKRPETRARRARKAPDGIRSRAFPGQ